MPISLPGGIIPPIPTFFTPDDTLDLPTLTRHVGWLTTAGVSGILVLGSNGEAAHLDDDERRQIIATTAALATTSTESVIVCAGTADLSTRGTIRRCKIAAEAGAQIAVVLPPFAYPTQMNVATLYDHYIAVAEASPLPVVIYNMPANTANLDLAAELVIRLSQHPNIVGLKDSSGNVTKMAQVIMSARSDFTVLAGSGSYLIYSMAAGAKGAIAAVANLLPEVLVRLHHLWEERFIQPEQSAARETVARQVQRAITPLNALVTTTYGVAGLKQALEIMHGYGGVPRRPLRPMAEDERRHLERTIKQTVEALEGITHA